MMKKRIILALVAALLAVSLSGCSGFTINVSELMRPPKATGENAEIQELIDKHAGDSYTLKYPQNGSYRSAVTTADIDGDNIEEAFAFYLPSGEAQTIHLLVMKSFDDEWKVVGDHTSNSTMVDRLLFCDLDSDGTKEIIVGYSTYNPLINDLSVYLVGENESTQIPTKNTYTEILTGDFTDSGRDELMLLSLYTPERPASASLVTLNDTKNSIYTIAETAIDDDIVSFSQLLTGNVSEGQFGVVIDGVTSQGTYSTQLLYYHGYFSSLERVHFTEDLPTNQASRSYAIKSTDIDSDGIIEIPNTFRMEIGQNLVDAVPSAMVYWCEYNELGTLTVDDKCIASIIYSFYFFIPESWEGHFTAFASYSSGEVTFCEWSEEDGMGDELMVIKVFSPEAWEEGTSTAGFMELARTDTYVYAFRTPQSNSSLMLTNEEIINSFQPLKKQ